MKMNKVKIKFLSFFPVAALLLLLNGCGYHVGYLMHPQVKSIAIAPVENETLVYNASAILRNRLTESFMREGSLKVESLRNADCILYARVIKVMYRETTPASYDNEITYRPMEWRIWMTVEFSVIIPGNKEPLVRRQQITADAIFQVQADYYINRQRGIEQCSWHLARKLTQQVTEAW
ncbi:MAG: LPS assembly lipoprotein LptE [Victivallaceae bacterium]|nr:LPS assembly lipoprotein LptE [Victivallaceae bacterium]